MLQGGIAAKYPRLSHWPKAGHECFIGGRQRAGGRPGGKSLEISAVRANLTPMEPSNAPGRNARRMVFFWCLVGAIHAFVFTAAFPFFSVVDEQAHFDLAVRYSHFDPPRSLGPPTEEAIPFITLYGTTEYLCPATSEPGGITPPPPWKQPDSALQKELQEAAPLYRAQFRNHEAASPPLYYTLAGGWWRLGRLMKLDGLRLLYWQRFLNIPILAALVALGAFGARRIFPENPFIQTAVPALIALLPQTDLYAINADSLTPFTFGAAFLALLAFWEADRPSPRLSALTGLALAAAFLTKGTNLPLVGAASAFLILKIAGWGRGGRGRGSWRSWLILALTAALPMAAWMAWCKMNFGDFTGAHAKTHYLGWTLKPFPEWFHHPLFSAAGVWYFLEKNIATFWQGGVVWQHQPLALPTVDLVYVVLSLGAVALALAAWASRPPPFTPSQRAAVGFAALCLLACFFFYAWLSVKYDFHDCVYPSRALPFFAAGRLMLGALIPFLLLFACGLNRLLGRLGNPAKFAVLGGWLAFMFVSEITLDAPVFASAYNWYHW